MSAYGFCKGVLLQSGEKLQVGIVFPAPDGDGNLVFSFQDSAAIIEVIAELSVGLEVVDARSDLKERLAKRVDELRQEMTDGKFTKIG